MPVKERLEDSKQMPLKRDFQWAEELLPKLLLLSHQTPEMSKSDFDALQDCTKLCEEILSMKRGAQWIDSVQKRLGKRDWGKSCSMGALVKKAGLSSTREQDGELAVQLGELRHRSLEKLKHSVPADVSNWLMHWENRLEGCAAQHSLVCIEGFYKQVDYLQHAWELRKQAAQTLELNIVGKIKSFLLARKEKSIKKNLESIHKEIDFRKKQISFLRDETAKTVGQIAMMFRYPLVYALNYTEQIQRSVLLTIERDIEVYLSQDSKIIFEKNEDLKLDIQKRSEFTKSVRTRIEELEKFKAERWISLRDNGNTNTVQRIAQATSRQFRLAYSSVESDISQEAEVILDLNREIEKAKREIQRLEKVTNEYSARLEENTSPSSLGHSSNSFSPAGAAQ
jgi:hypothetical protein